MSDSMDLKFALLEAQKELANAKATLLKQTHLLRRWNVAASGAGMCGSEFVDEPERVFDRLKDHASSLRNMLIKAKLEAKREAA